MGSQAKAETDNLRLAKYVIFLLLDDRKRNDFVKNSEGRKAKMRAAKLTEEEQRLVTTPCFVELCAYVDNVAHMGPVVQPEPVGSE